MFSLFFCIFLENSTFLPCGELCFPQTRYEVSVNAFYSTKIQTISLFVIVECQKRPIKFSRKNHWVTNIFIIFIYEIRFKNLLKKSLVSLNLYGNAEIFSLRYQNLSRDNPKIISRYAYAGNVERRKYSSNPFPTRHEKEVVGRLQPLYPRERNSTLCTGGWVVLGACLDGTENLACTGIRSSDRPAPSVSLYPPLTRSTLQIFLAKKATVLTFSRLMTYIYVVPHR